ncbi:DNA-directed RNA polymerase subunit omega [Coraliomargarita akajimensis]|uniref:DNA-directed RNA polymerase subunit omega n=1 Tax=Coraliomargarita akajimensis TaxID=395922 RepID=UPI001C261D03|nr:DNA-directed RNA polymerase subunit omega [Coraliomargarita akajimensis]
MISWEKGGKLGSGLNLSIGFLEIFTGIPIFYCQRGQDRHFRWLFQISTISGELTLRDDYLQQAQEVITDPMILINVVSRRAKQLKSGYKPLIESLERLSAEDMALREIIEGKITYQLAEPEEA